MAKTWYDELCDEDVMDNIKLLIPKNSYPERETHSFLGNPNSKEEGYEVRGYYPTGRLILHPDRDSY